MAAVRYPVAAPDLSGNEAAYVAECLRSTRISSQGAFLDRFERQVAERVGAREAVATSNGTTALHVALLALGIGPGDEVIVPALTFVATANAVVYCGAKPVIADCLPDTWCMSPESARRLIGPRTRALVPVHLYGHPCNMPALAALAAEHGLAIVEDAAEALGAEIEGRPVGNWGRAATFSFFGNKIVATGEGGMVVTDDAALADRVRRLRGQGVDPQRRYWHDTLGYNFRLTNLAAAIGVAQMERLDAFLAARRRIANWYRRELASVPGLTLPTERTGARHAYWMYTVLAPPQVDRDALMRRLADAGIETRPVFYPLHELPVHQGARTDRDCPVARAVARCGVSLPTYTELTAHDVAFISAALRDALESLAPQRRRAA